MPALRRVLGLGFGLAVATGSIIGAGILRAPGDVAAHVPGVALFLGVWVAGALYALIGAMSLAELGTTLPESGGQYVFARHAFGSYAGFVVGWVDWLSTCGSVAAVALVIGEATVALVGGPASHAPTAPVMIALAIILVLAAVQWSGIRWSDRAQALTSTVKALALALLIAACIAWWFAHGTASTSSSHAAALARAPAAVSVAGAIVALQGVIYTYDGWSAPIYFSEEIQDGGRAIPRAMIGGVIGVAVLYLLINVAFLLVVPERALAADPFAANTVASVIFGARGTTVVHLLIAVALVSAVSADLLMAQRVLFALGRDQLAIPLADRVNAGGTPSVALFATVVVAALFLLGGTFSAVVGVLALCFVADYVISFLALFALRMREPARPRPFSVPGYPWVPAVALVSSVAFLIGAAWGDPRSSLIALALGLASYPVYRAIRGRHARVAVPATPNA